MSKKTIYCIKYYCFIIGYYLHKTIMNEYRKRVSKLKSERLFECKM